jgi:ribonuclease BN (tRNA processing enzyme)
MSTVSLKVIGCGDAFGSGGRMNTCFFVRTPSTQFLIDCGATTLVGLKEHGITTDNIDLIAITHFHGDHFGGLPFLILDAVSNGRTKPLTIVSPPGCKEKLLELIQLFYPGSTIIENLQINFKEYKAYEPIITEHVTFLAYPAIHAESSLPHGLRINTANKIISYSGDTEWTNELIELAKNADLFICECNSYKSNLKGHLNYQTLQTNISLLSYKKVLLTHFNEEMLNNLDKIEMDCATDGKTIIL